MSDNRPLFARLFIEELCILNNERAILQALGDLPRKISDFYARRFRRVQDHHLAKDAVKILRYCGCTKRSLTANEFGELLSLIVSQKSLDRESIPTNMDHIIMACYGLVYVEEEEATIHYVHDSVRHYLFNSSNAQPEGFIESEVDTHIGSLCLTYLNFNDFNRSLTRTTALANTPIAPINIGMTSLRMRSNIVNEMARKLLKARRSMQHTTVAELSRRAEDILGEAESSRLRAETQSYPYYLLDYVRNLWIWHTVRFDVNSDDWYRFVACVDGENELARRPWAQDVNAQQVPVAKTSLIPRTAWALAQDHRALLFYDILQDNYTLGKVEQTHNLEQETMVKGLQEEIMQHAVRVRDPHLARAVISYGHRSPRIGAMGLRYAVSLGDEDFVALCIRVGADVNAGSHRDGEGLISQAAADRGNLIILQPDAKADAWVAKGGGVSVLQAAAARGYIEVVKVLLQAKANVNVEPAGLYGRTALQAAAEGGHLEIVEQLLLNNADVNAKASSAGRTALQAAAGGGHHEIVLRLLQAKADVNADPAKSDGRTALQAAAEGGHLAVVERLLQAKADVNAEPAHYSGRTALQAAAGGGHRAVVERLLQAKANVNAEPADTQRRTALQAAAVGGHLAVIDRLLQAGAQVNTSLYHYDQGSYRKRTALQLAKKYGHHAVVERLKRAGASEDINAESERWSTRAQ